MHAVKINHLSCYIHSVSVAVLSVLLQVSFVITFREFWSKSFIQSSAGGVLIRFTMPLNISNQLNRPFMVNCEVQLDLACKSMGNMKKGLFFVVVVVGEFLGSVRMILSFVSDSFPSSYPIHKLFLLCIEAVKGINDRRKEMRIFLCLNFILGLTTILWCKCFPEPVEIVTSPILAVEIYQRVIFGKF